MNLTPMNPPRGNFGAPCTCPRPTPRRRRARAVEIGGVSAVQGSDRGALGQADGLGPLEARSARDPDRRAARAADDRSARSQAPARRGRGTTENRATVRARRIGLVERGSGPGCGSGAGVGLGRRFGRGDIRGAGTSGRESGWELERRIEFRGHVHQACVGRSAARGKARREPASAGQAPHVPERERKGSPCQLPA